MKVLSYNIHKGFNFRSQKFILLDLRTEILKQNPDIIFLQEVMGRHDLHAKKIKGWPTLSQYEFLAQDRYPYFAYGKNAATKTSHHGNAILSKYPITFSENIDISQNAFEKRGLLHAVVQVTDETHLDLFCVHLNLLEKSRIKQATLLCKILKEKVKPDRALILAGDFNDWRCRITSLMKKRLTLNEFYYVTRGYHARTFPAKFPTLSLDRIYFRGLKLTEAHTLSKREFRNLSDHLPITALFDIEEML